MAGLATTGGASVAGDSGQGSGHRIEAYRRLDSERLMAYTDAVMSIIATILVLPLKVESEEGEGKTLREVMDEKNMYTTMGTFVVTFIYISLFWRAHRALFLPGLVMKPLMLYLNFAFLLSLSFLPFVAALVTGNKEQPVALALFYGLLGYIAVVRLVTAVYASVALGWEHAGNSVTLLRIGALIAACIAAVSCAWSLGSSVNLFLIIYLAGRATANSGYVQQMLGIEPAESEASDDVPDGDRVIFFSDGVYAISSTLIVLDLPAAPPGLSDAGLTAFLSHEGTALLSYVICAYVVGLLWMGHYSLMHDAETLPRMVERLNNVHLIFVALMPFGSNLLILYGQSDDSPLAIGIFVAIAGSAALLLSAMAGWRLYKALRSLNNRVPSGGSHEGTWLLTTTESDVDEAEALIARLKRNVVFSFNLPLTLVVGILLSLWHKWLFVAILPLSGYLALALSLVYGRLPCAASPRRSIGSVQ